jgi:acetyl esterase/lipase
VIYYLHGGAYRFGHPASSIAPFLRIAELADKRGISIAVFALDYSFAPEAKYPTQLNEAKAAYRYLLKDQNIDPAKLAIFGDSAGGHLLLNLLCALADEKSLPKPSAGAFLISPWLDLRCSNDGSFIRNQHLDWLVYSELKQAGEQVMPRKLDKTVPHIVNFVLPRPDKQSWADILPSKVFVAMGGNEMLLDDAVAWVDQIKADGIDVQLEIDEGRSHIWHMMDDLFDTDPYFAATGEVPVGLMTGAAAMAEAIISTVSR